jgi:hypothetical protein
VDTPRRSGVFSRHCSRGTLPERALRRFNRQIREGTPNDPTVRPDGATTDRSVPTLIASSTGWQVGIALGVVVILVAAAIVIMIVLLALEIARQAKASEQAVALVRQQTAELGGIAQINDSGVRILHAARALRKVAVGK